MAEDSADVSSSASLLQPVATSASAELEFRQSERVLAESRQFLKQVIDAIADPVFVKDRQHRWILLNQAFCELTGHRLEDLLGKSDYDFFPAHEADVFWAKDEVVFNSGEEDANEEEITSHDGVTRTIITKKTRYTDDGGQQFLVGCIMDITARKQAEALLSRREEEFRALAENLPDPIFRYDRNCRRIYVNPAVELMCGKSAASLMGGSPDDGAILSRDAGKKLVDFIRRVAETGQSFETEIEVVPPDGSIHYYHNRYVPEWGRNGEVASVLSISREITDRKLAEQAFSHSRKILEEAQRIGHIGSWELDVASGALAWSDEIYRIFEVDAARFSPSYEAFLALVHPDDRDRVSEAYCASIRHRTLYEVEHRLLFADGRIKHVHERGETFYDADNKPLRSIGTVQDITERKALEIELVRHRDHLQELVAEQTSDLLLAKQAAEAASQAKSMFLANMSHELRTPLHGILSFSQLGLDKLATAESAKVEKFLTHISESGSRLLGLVNDLLDLSKLESGKAMLDFQPVCLAGLARDVVAEFEPMLDERTLRLELEVADCDTVLLMDRQGMEQVMRNLLSNAFKFSPTGGQVSVRIEHAMVPSVRGADGPELLLPGLRLIVADRGPGIPEGELEQVFDEFVQSSCTRNGAGGTGLGLPICRRIVAAHQGHIAAYNRQGGGAEFVVLLPEAEIKCQVP